MRLRTQDAVEIGLDQTIRMPLFQMAGSVAPVKIDGELIPIQDGPLHASAAPPIGFGNYRAEESRTYLPAAELGKHEEILEEEGGEGKKCGIGFEDERVADGFSIDEREVRFDAGAFAEQVGYQSGLGGGVRRIELFIIREGVDQGEEGRSVGGGDFADFDHAFRWSWLCLLPNVM